MTRNLNDRIIECGREALKRADVAYDELSCILLVGGQTRMPSIQKDLQNTFNVTLNKSVNPDEAVAMGAAIQANIIMGGEGSKDILLLDVTPLSLGIETMGGVMTTLVEANTTIPVRKSQTFTTAEDNQPSVTINVLQGARPMARDNKSIGLFNLDGIAPARRGVPQIEVTFEIDANGMLSVSAKDKATNKEQKITIENKNSLSDEEVERIKREAEEYAAEDAKTKAKLEKANKCESLIFSIERTSETMKEHMTDEDNAFMSEKKKRLEEMKKEGDYSNLDSLESEINARWNEISVKAYSNGGTNGQPDFMNDIFAKANMGQQTGPKPDNENIEEQEAF